MESPNEQPTGFLRIVPLILLAFVPHFIMWIPTYFSFMNFNSALVTEWVFASAALITVLILAKLYVWWSENESWLAHPAGTLAQSFNWLIIGTQHMYFQFPVDFVELNTLHASRRLVVFFFALHLFFWTAVAYGYDAREHLHLYGKVVYPVHLWMLVAAKNILTLMLVFIIVAFVVVIFSLLIILLLFLALGVMSCRVLRGLCSREPEVLQPGAFVEALQSCQSLLPSSIFKTSTPTGTNPPDSPGSTSGTKQELEEEEVALSPSSTRGTADLESGLVKV